MTNTHVIDIGIVFISYKKVIQPVLQNVFICHLTGL